MKGQTENFEADGSLVRSIPVSHEAEIMMEILKHGSHEEVLRGYGRRWLSRGETQQGIIAGQLLRADYWGAVPFRWGWGDIFWYLSCNRVE
ncbi:MAG: hypothetical protein PHI06_08970 [Desulfobulbaceae bacterium]|nr:hypothetical protein [Desulfobulbaceae bacterium]